MVRKEPGDFSLSITLNSRPASREVIPKASFGDDHLKTLLLKLRVYLRCRSATSDSSYTLFLSREHA